MYLKIDLKLAKGNLKTMLKTQELSKKNIEQSTANVMYDSCEYNENDNKSKAGTENSIVENVEKKAIPSINFDYKQLIVPKSDEGIVYRTSSNNSMHIEKSEIKDKSNEIFYRNVTIAGWIACVFGILAFFVITLQ